MPFTVLVQMKKTGRLNRTDIAPVPYELDRKPQTVQELLASLTRLGVDSTTRGRMRGRFWRI